MKPVYLAVAVLLSACQTSVVFPNLPNNTETFEFGGTPGFVSEITPAQETAAEFLLGTARYDEQRFANHSAGFGFISHSLAANRFEYAHTLGVTGAGEIIAIRDNGFDTTHEEFTGKTILFEIGYSKATITKRNHGTAVAALAAGSGDHGDTVGAAPGATILLSGWQDQPSEAFSVWSAENAGAIVINNSWNYVCNGDPFNECGINDYDSSFIPTSYANALLDYAGSKGVVVFAASNENGQSQSAYMPALPLHISGLEEGWLAVINLARDFEAARDGYFQNAPSSVTLLSSGCKEAARWCVAADGTARIATAHDPDGYELGTGTSYAAPRVSGAIAILAEAFPALTPAELRNRLLVTADNNFFTDGDPLIQTMTFANGITHEYHWTYGHGFADVRAALLPIGAVTTRAATGAEISLDAPLIVSGAGVGVAPKAELSKVTLAANDQMGGVFSANAAQFATHAANDFAHLYHVSALSGRDLGKERSAHTALGDNALFEKDKTLSLQVSDAVTLDTRLPAHNADMAGARLTYETTYLGGELSLGISHLQANADPIGLSQIASQNISSEASSIHMDWQTALSESTTLSLSALAGVSSPNEAGTFARLSDMRYSDLGIGISQRGVLTEDDWLSLTLRQPLAATSGTAHLALETMDGSGKATLSDIGLNLAPATRAYEIGVAYQTQGPFGTEWQFSATHTENAGHSAGQTALNIDAAVQLRF